MAETLVELIARIKADATQLEQGLTGAEKATEASSKKMQDSLKKVGTVMAASGAAIIATLGLMGKAAIDEDINMKRLATTINNSGTAYDSVKDSLEAVISATQRKTGVADNEQRDILNRLILVTNDYGKAMELLPTVLDLAAAGEMDATTAATYLGKAFLELEDGAEEVSVRFGQASLKFKDMEDIQNRVRGSAENLANPLSVLAASIGDVAEEIGMSLIPLIKDATSKIVDIAIKVQDWVKEHPELAKTLTLVALGLGAVLTVVGGLILVMPVITSLVAAFGVVFHAALGPIGLISLAIAGLITWVTWLIVNMDKMIHFWDDVFSNMKIIALTAIDAILTELERFIGWLPILGDKISEARNNIANMIKVEKIVKDARDTRDALKDVGEALEDTTEIVKENTDATEEQTKAALANIKALEEQQTALEETTNKLNDMREEYEYTRSDAGRLKITVKDVTFALFDMGKTTEEITSKFVELGEDADNVNKVMKSFGITAQEVNDILNTQKENIDKLGDSYNETSNKASDFAKTQIDIDKLKGAIAGKTGAEKEAAILGYQWGKAGYGSEADYITGQRGGWAGDIYGYQDGGVVPGPVGQPQLAMVHGGETVLPANESIGNVTVNFTQPVFFDREDTMNKFVDKISKTLDRKYRLSGRSLV